MLKIRAFRMQKYELQWTSLELIHNRTMYVNTHKKYSIWYSGSVWAPIGMLICKTDSKFTL